MGVAHIKLLVGPEANKVLFRGVAVASGSDQLQSVAGPTWTPR